MEKRKLNRYDMLLKFFQAILDNPRINQTNLMYKVNLNSKAILYYINYCSDKGLLINNVKWFELTPKGFKIYAKLLLLVDLEELNDFHCDWKKVWGESVNCPHRDYFKGARYWICADCGSDFLTQEEYDGRLEWLD